MCFPRQQSQYSNKLLDVQTYNCCRVDPLQSYLPTFMLKSLKLQVEPLFNLCSSCPSIHPSFYLDIRSSIYLYSSPLSIYPVQSSIPSFTCLTFSHPNILSLSSGQEKLMSIYISINLNFRYTIHSSIYISIQLCHIYLLVHKPIRLSFACLLNCQKIVISSFCQSS